MSLKESAEEYRQAMELKHGWDVELECTTCGHRGVPGYQGWTPKYPTSFGSTPTIFADLECSSCGRNLKAEAGEKLVEMFEGVDIPRANRWLLVAFTLGMVGLVAASAVILALTGSLWGIIPIFFLIPVLAFIPFFNRRIAALRQSCDCGEADYVFMGMLGRTYCFRCASCGRLLRLRD